MEIKVRHLTYDFNINREPRCMLAYEIRDGVNRMFGEIEIDHNTECITEDDLKKIVKEKIYPIVEKIKGGQNDGNSD